VRLPRFLKISMDLFGGVLGSVLHPVSSSRQALRVKRAQRVLAVCDSSS